MGAAGLPSLEPGARWPMGTRLASILAMERSRAGGPCSGPATRGAPLRNAAWPSCAFSLRQWGVDSWFKALV